MLLVRAGHVSQAHWLPPPRLAQWGIFLFGEVGVHGETQHTQGCFLGHRDLSRLSA
ncbi:MAG: hypothetical protein ACREVK_10225 [Gammaproteobacteria bacterium]